MSRPWIDLKAVKPEDKDWLYSNGNRHLVEGLAEDKISTPAKTPQKRGRHSKKTDDDQQS